MLNVKIAVIGKSSAGKSAFIRSFSSMPEYINSVGRGQTTRAYAEYLFQCNFSSDIPIVDVKVMKRNEFSENRTIQVFDKIKKEINETDIDINWLNEQFCDETFNEQIKDIMLFSDDFFNIKEFVFIDKSVTVQNILNCYEDLIFKTKSIIEEKEKSEKYSLNELINEFYEDIYDIVIKAIDNKFENYSIFIKENNIRYFRFEVEEKYRDLFSLLLKVVKNDDGSESSYTGIISKVRVTSKLNTSYAENISDAEISSITLIDTYGLDHSESIDKILLTERYNKIFNKDYPEITIAFLIESLRAGASNDFKSAIMTLYEVKPEIMTYIVGTYIDDNEMEIIQNVEWLFSEDKTLNSPPQLNGKVLQILEQKGGIKATLVRNGISKSMADKRCEIMQKRFAPFCGDETKWNGKIDYERLNNTSVRTLFLSIADKEHLGDGYIEIDKIINGINNELILHNFIEEFIKKVTSRFKKLYENTASRTRWKVRENLENYILGFDGSTIDATWVRAFRDAFYQVFSKEIKIDDKNMTLSDVWQMEGNSKIAFDELMNKLFPYAFKQGCKQGNILNLYFNELNCSKCCNEKINNDMCIWNLFINIAGLDLFKKRVNYELVLDWLNALHDFTSKRTDDFISKIEMILKRVMAEQMVYLCRERNIYIASKKINKFEGSYIEIKREVYEEYKRKFDSSIDIEFFNEQVNRQLSY